MSENNSTEEPLDALLYAQFSYNWRIARFDPLLHVIATDSEGTPLIGGTLHANRDGHIYGKVLDRLRGPDGWRAIIFQIPSGNVAEVLNPYGDGELHEFKVPLSLVRAIEGGEESA